MASRLDPAAQNIARELTQSHGFKPDPDSTNDVLRLGEVLLKHVETDSIHIDSLGINIDVNAVIFASRHKSETNEPALTVHWTGNVTSSADFGGRPKSLSYADPPRLRAALLALDEARRSRRLNYTVTMEATHHGPTELGVPTLFVEIGSTEKEWNDPTAASCAAEAVWRAATSPVEGKNAVGFGGGHYCSKQTIATRKDGFAFGHVFSKYFFEEYDEAMVRMAFERSGNCRSAVIDWKGVRGSQRLKLLETLKKMEIEIVRV
jgi:D-aminoacyl-tRNA deacylase